MGFQRFNLWALIFEMITSPIRAHFARAFPRRARTNVANRLVRVAERAATCTTVRAGPRACSEIEPRCCTTLVGDRWSTLGGSPKRSRVHPFLETSTCYAPTMFPVACKRGDLGLRVSNALSDPHAIRRKLAPSSAVAVVDGAVSDPRLLQTPGQ